MPTLKKETTKTAVRRSKPTVSPATRARVEKRAALQTNKIITFKPRRPSIIEELKAEAAARRGVEALKYNGLDLFQTSVTVGLAVLVVCMFAWR